MVKSPEEYFQDQEFHAEAGNAKGDFTSAERAFMQKYLGVDENDILRKMGIKPGQAALVDAAEAASAGESLDAIIRDEPELQMVAFFLGNQEYTVPTLAVQEVIKFSQPTKLPAAPAYVAGIINLRGRVTPLVRLRDLLEIPATESSTDHFIVVCRRRGLQLGLMIERVHTMYRVPQERIDWAVESHLGINVDYISGLLKADDRLVGIVSVDRIVDTVLQR